MSKEIIKKIKQFTKDRDWEQFHTGENLAKSIVIEASELLELFQWSKEPKSLESLKDEIADIMIYAILLSERYNFNINEIILNKIVKNNQKYPVEKTKGSSKKYTEY